MKNFICSLLILLVPVNNAFSQKIQAKLSFMQGQTLEIAMNAKTTFSQEAMGQAIDISVDGSGYHTFKVTNATDDNTTLHHEIKRMTFNFDGMGTKRAFDSDNKKDMDGLFGPGIRDILKRTYDIIIDPTGKTLLVRPEKMELAKTDERMLIIASMLKDITAVAYPPKKNEASFFMILPSREVTVGDNWTEAGEDSLGKFKTTYTLSAVTDTSVVVDIKGNSFNTAKSEFMGMQSTTTMNSSYTGKAILDRKTGIIKEKTIITNSTGTTEMMGNSTPVTSKTTITVHVRPLP